MPPRSDDWDELPGLFHVEELPEATSCRTALEGSDVVLVEEFRVEPSGRDKSGKRVYRVRHRMRREGLMLVKGITR